MKTLVIYGYGTLFNEEGSLVNPSLTEKILKKHIRLGNHVWIGVASPASDFEIKKILGMDMNWRGNESISFIGRLSGYYNGYGSSLLMHRELVDTDYDLYEHVIYFDRYALEIGCDTFLGRYINAIHVPVFEYFLMQSELAHLNFHLPSMTRTELEKVISLVERGYENRNVIDTKVYLHALKSIPPLTSLQIRTSAGLLIIDFDDSIVDCEYRFFPGAAEMLSHFAQRNVDIVCITGRRWSAQHTECFNAALGEDRHFLRDEDIYDVHRSRQILNKERFNRSEMLEWIIKEYGFSNQLNKVHFLDDLQSHVEEATQHKIPSTQVLHVGETKPWPIEGFYDQFKQKIDRQLNLTTANPTRFYERRNTKKQDNVREKEGRCVLF